MKEHTPQILLTNDDGIDSPGLWAAAEALSAHGYVWVAAPRDQASGTGRSMPLTSDGRITVIPKVVHGQEWKVHSIGGTPAQTVVHAIHEIIGTKPDLVVSGINYGANFGLAVTISGTVGAAIEAATNGIPSIAISMETDPEHFYTHSEELDFSAAGYFTAYFAGQLLNKDRTLDANFLKIEVPADATPETEWKLTRLSMRKYYKIPYGIKRDWDQPNFQLPYELEDDIEGFELDSDARVVLGDRKVAVTPLTLDMTARVDFGRLGEQLGKLD
jgi:5'-nucleotidase